MMWGMMRVASDEMSECAEAQANFTAVPVISSHVARNFPELRSSRTLAESGSKPRSGNTRTRDLLSSAARKQKGAPVDQIDRAMEIAIGVDIERSRSAAMLNCGRSKEPFRQTN